eukprot:gnl/Ergobibamus_cyprinoides/1573.p1 GENE.gnl/Ergobibamus_cyprinoides/1573~~gnl/Ergobibamus_cyprinoides/1573.p1  ORF type:complete len:125 (+),score=31.67 gnl/Ergobibamus_cyprinoides/1573:33-377(+)
MLAADYDRTDCVALLLNREAGIADINGRTALMHAALEGHADCTSLLLSTESGAVDADGICALTHAARAGHADCVMLLSESEADFVQTTASGASGRDAAQETLAAAQQMLQDLFW